MSSTNLNSFIKALEDVKNDYTCGVCNQLCKDAITLSKCFHLICSEHFESLKNCPKCNVSLEGSTIYTDDRLNVTIDSARQLGEIFEKFKPPEVSSSTKKRRKKSIAQDSPKEFAPKVGVSNKKGNKRIYEDDQKEDSKENTNFNHGTEANSKSKSENVNVSPKEFPPKVSNKKGNKRIDEDEQIEDSKENTNSNHATKADSKSKSVNMSRKEFPPKVSNKKGNKRIDEDEQIEDSKENTNSNHATKADSKSKSVNMSRKEFPPKVSNKKGNKRIDEDEQIEVSKENTNSNHASKSDSKSKSVNMSRKEFPPKVSNKKGNKRIDEDEQIDDSKENTNSNHATKADSKSKNESVNMSLISNASSRFNKGIQKRNHRGETLLHIACRLGKVDKVMELLEQGANTNTKDYAFWTPLHEVVQTGRLDLVKLLLQHNTLINVPGQHNETPLHEAVRYKHKDIAEELVKNGADINAPNCKGETPIQLASDEMKQVLNAAAENIIQTQGVNVTLISELHSALDFDDIRVYCVSQYRTVHNKLKVLGKHHSNLQIEQKFTKKVTHLIVDAEDGICLSSLDVLQAIVGDCWILASDWVTKSTEQQLEQFLPHEVSGVGTSTNRGPKNARYNKYKQLPRIFDGCHFYLHNFNTKYEISKSLILTKAILAKLITDADGTILKRVPNPESIPDSEKLVPYHAKKEGKLVNCAHYIIFKDMYEPMYNMSHLKALPVGWLIECIEKYELCEPW